MSSVLNRTGPFTHRNPRLYVLFTTLYNARAYYPVLAIFFTDLGLSLERFVFLNLMWALAIFTLEVPSGAMADTIGRKKLLVFAWAGSGQDKVTASIGADSNKKPIVYVEYIRGLTRDLRQHVRLFAVPKDLPVEVDISK